MEMAAAVVGPETSSRGRWDQREGAVLWVEGAGGLVCMAITPGGLPWMGPAVQWLRKGHSKVCPVQYGNH